MRLSKKAQTVKKRITPLPPLVRGGGQTGDPPKMRSVFGEKER